MNKQIALAYGIAGLAVAVAAIVVIGTSVGLFGGRTSDKGAEPGAEATAAVDGPMSRADAPPVQGRQPVNGAWPAGAQPAAADGPVEVVYVDEPAAQRRRGDDERYEHEHGEHERGEHERWEHEDDDD